ncbi:MAG: 5-formyltetrahydrofolate cyclo-ligase [Pedobacter sp.]|nr:MAG: 5-formyltetrahydrofolate cyclo-ligase [Pedobacter sp.]
MANKSDLRKHALAQRKSLNEEQAALLSEALLAAFKTLDLSNINVVHVFLPILRHNEPNTFLIIDWLQANHPDIKIVVPKADFETHTMSNYVFNSLADLKNNHYEIPEPQNSLEFAGIPDMVLVPLLAFDQKGYRVGYGKGFYDRFLQNMHTQKIGLSFFEPVAQINDVHLNDIRLDKCITPSGIINFGI